MICSSVDLSWGGSTQLLLGVLKTAVSHVKVNPTGTCCISLKFRRTLNCMKFSSKSRYLTMPHEFEARKWFPNFQIQIISGTRCIGMCVIKSGIRLINSWTS